jgi:phytoene synthase
MSAPAAPSDEAAVATLLREQDPDRALTTLFAPPAARAGLQALYAFSGEIARVRSLVSDPLPGEMRFQWWRDLLAGSARGAAEAHPVAAQLLLTLERFNLPRQPLLDLIEARTFDLYDDPMPTVTDLEGYCGETASALIRLGSLVLANGRDPGGAEAAGHAGVAYAVTGLLRSYPWHAQRGQLYLPAELMATHGLTRDAALSGVPGPALAAVLAALRTLARHHLAETRARIGSVAPELAPAFLPVALVEPLLARMERADYDPFRTIIGLPPWRRLWVVWRAARRSGL